MRKNLAFSGLRACDMLTIENNTNSCRNQTLERKKSMGTLLDERLVILDADVNTAEECIRLMANLFETYGYVKPGYGDAVVLREAEYPTGLPGKNLNLAIPHTNNLLVNRPAVGVIIPRRPVRFAMMGMKENLLDCSVVIPLVVQDSKRQLQMLKKMMKIIQDGPLLQKLRDSKDKAEILACLSSLDEDETN